MIGAGGDNLLEATGVTTMAGAAEGRVAATEIWGGLRRLAITKNPSTASSAPPTDSTIKRCLRGSEESSGKTKPRERVTGASVPSSTSTRVRSLNSAGELKRALWSADGMRGVNALRTPSISLKLGNGARGAMLGTAICFEVSIASPNE